uniref:Transmembrane protein n=1 Tax=Heterorhabditis bacteriophora TaxID=37862 RepID=A0A1I7W9R9_HETBA
MFGTFEAERTNDPPIYGLVHNEQTFNQIWLQMHTFLDILIFKGQMKNEKGQPIFPGVINKVIIKISIKSYKCTHFSPSTIRFKVAYINISSDYQIKSALYPPGWLPGVPVLPFFHWMSLIDPKLGVPEPIKPVMKYNPSLEIWIKIYLMAHFTLLLAIFFHFEYDRANLSYLEFYLKLAFFLLTMQSFGAFFDKRKIAPYLEIPRCAGVIGFYIILIMDENGAGPHRIFMITFHSLSGLFWTGYCIRKSINSPRKCRVVKPTQEKQMDQQHGQKGTDSEDK